MVIILVWGYFFRSDDWGYFVYSHGIGLTKLEGRNERGEGDTCHLLQTKVLFHLKWGLWDLFIKSASPRSSLFSLSTSAAHKGCVEPVPFSTSTARHEGRRVLCSKKNITTNGFFKMVGPSRPQFVLFGSSIVQLCFSHGGWGSILSDIYSRKVFLFLLLFYISRVLWMLLDLFLFFSLFWPINSSAD